MTKFDQLKERFPSLIPVQELRANVSIIELALHYGYELRPQKGKSRPVLEHLGYSDTIIIKNPQEASQQLYQRAGDFSDAGTILDFIRNRLTTVFASFNQAGAPELKNSTAVLYDYLRVDPQSLVPNRNGRDIVAKPEHANSSAKQPFDKEQFDIRPLEDENYLHQRHITSQTLQRPEFSGKVVSQITYFDPVRGQTDPFVVASQHPKRNYRTFANVAFPYYNAESRDVTGLEIRNQNVKLHAPGSDRINSVFISNPPPITHHFFVLESVIDALSHQQLRSLQGDEAFDTVYFSTGGQLTPQQVSTITRYISSLEKKHNWQIHLSFDNDTKGHGYDLHFIQQLTSVKFPLQPTLAPRGRMAYLLPKQAVYQALRERLLKQIEPINTETQSRFTNNKSNPVGQTKLADQLITVIRSGLQYQISIPALAPALKALNSLLLDVTGFGQRIQISKAQSKDFNQDLSQRVNGV